MPDIFEAFITYQSSTVELLFNIIINRFVDEFFSDFDEIISKTNCIYLQSLNIRAVFLFVFCEYLF